MVLGYVSRLGFTLDWDGTGISVVRNSYTPGELVKDVIDNYRLNVADERINYTVLDDPAVLVSYTTATTEAGYDIEPSVGTEAIAQSFEVSSGNYVLDSCKFKLYKEADDGGNVYVEVYEHTGTFGSTSKPTGTALATSDTINISDLSSSASWVKFSFTGANRITLEGGYYCLAIHCSTGGTDYITCQIDSASTTDPGNFSATSNGSTWTTTSSWDILFEIFYENNTVSETGSDISYTSNAKSCIQTIDRAREMAGATWYWYVDADNVFYFREYSTTPDHKFVFGKDVSYLEVERNADDIKNEFIFWNGLQPDDEHFLSTRYYNSSSITSYWNRFDQLTDSRILTDETADLLADAYINAYKEPNISLRFEVKDNNFGEGYDIESIEPGQTCKILNIEDSNIINDNMVITSVSYT